jgi:CDP-paratose 2-epimerase
VIKAFESFAEHPHPGEVYNLGGGRENAASVLECIQMIKDISGYEVKWTYLNQNRVGDHICFISDLRKLRAHFPQWSITRSLTDIIEEMIRSEVQRMAT